MTEKEAVRGAMKSRKWTQATLAKEAGYKGQQNITAFLNKNTTAIRTDALVRLLNAMGYELVVRDKMGSGTEFVIDMKEEIPEK